MSDVPGGVAGPSCPQLESTALPCSGLSPSLQEGCRSPQKPSWSPDSSLVTGKARPSHCCPLRKFIDLPILCLVMKFIDPEGQWQFINRADPGFRGQVEERLGVGRGHASLQGALVSEQKDRLGTGCTRSPGVSGRQTPGAVELGRRGCLQPSWVLSRTVFSWSPPRPRLLGAELTSNSPGGTRPQLSPEDPAA